MLLCVLEVAAYGTLNQTFVAV